MFGDMHTHTYSYTGISIYIFLLFGENTMLMHYTNYTTSLGLRPRHNILVVFTHFPYGCNR